MNDLAREDDERLLDKNEVKELTRRRLRRHGLFPDYVAGRYHTLGQIREGLAEQRARAEVRSKAYAAEPISRRGRRSKVA